MHGHKVQKFTIINKEVRKAAAEKVKFAALNLKQRIDDIRRRSDGVKIGLCSIADVRRCLERIAVFRPSRDTTNNFLRSKTNS